MNINEIEQGPIFIHIPKTGGTSISKNIQKHIPLNQHHRQVSFYGEHISKKFVFTFVRNPYDRIVSVYHYLNQGLGNSRDNALGANLPKNFKSFVKNYLCNLDINKPVFRPHMLPMTFWLDGEVDFIGRFENLQKDYDTLCHQLNIPIQILPIHNKSQHNYYRKYYDDETKKIIEQIYHVDISRFNYTF